MSLEKRLAALTPEQRRLFEEKKELARRQMTRSSIPQRSGSGNEFAATADQSALWYFQKVDPTAYVYNVTHPFLLKGDLDLELLNESLNRLVSRHEILRTTFVERDGLPFQVIHEFLPQKILFFDLAQDPDGRSRAKHQATSLARRPFDLESGPLFRLSVLKLSEREHAVLATLHHTLTDWWAFQVFFRELFEFYQSLVEKRPPRLPQLPIQFADYSEWRREWLEGDACQRQMTYWLEKLTGAPTLLELPTDFERSKKFVFEGATCARELPPDLLEQMRQFNASHKSTVFVTLLTAYYLFLHKYSGSSDLLVGTPATADRELPETRNLIGYLINTLVLRGVIEKGMTILQLVEQVKETVIKGFANKDLPFRFLVQKLNPIRELGRMPLYQAEFLVVNMEGRLFDIQDRVSLDYTMPGFEISVFEMDRKISPVDLLVGFAEAADSLSVFLEYNSRLFTAKSMERMSDHLQRALTMVVEAPSSRVEEIELLSETEREQQIVEWNSTQRKFNEQWDGQNVCELIEAQADRSPDAVAISSGGVEYSYRELNARANRLARYLQKSEVGPEVLVGVCAERGPLMMVALLAIWKVGGAYLPLEYDYPVERLRFILQDAGARIVMTTKEGRNRLGPMEGQLIDLDEEGALIRRESGDNIRIDRRPSDLSYVIYTSGSTGRPKGVLVEHGSVANRLHWMAEEYDLDGKDVFLQKTSYGFDVSVWELFLPLILGAKLVLLEPGGEKDPAKIIKAINQERVTAIHFVPSMLGIFLDSLGGDRSVASLRHCFCSGEALAGNLASRALKILGQNVRLHNLYGPTETTVDATFYAVKEAGSRIPIGRPVANTTAYILDEQRRLVPIGVTGELYLGGVQVARGYLNRPELTAERFLPSPFQEGERLYRTGDLARFLENGDIEYLGRIDQQVKIRGYRIELEEIENRLAKHRSIKGCAVSAGLDNGGNSRLIAYIVHSGSTNESVGELRRYLLEQLPEYMVPADWIVLPQLPTTANGKLDRKRLSHLEGNRLTANETYAEPTSPIERTLARIWAEVLNLNRIGVNDNFFDLGGHSLLATQVVSRTHRALGVDLPIAFFFEVPTIRAMSERIEWMLPAPSPGENGELERESGTI